MEIDSFRFTVFGKRQIEGYQKLDTVYFLTIFFQYDLFKLNFIEIEKLFAEIKYVCVEVER